MTTIWKRTVGPECGPDDQYECCGCAGVFGRKYVAALSDGWYCERCVRANNVDAFEDPANVRAAIVKFDAVWDTR